MTNYSTASLVNHFRGKKKNFLTANNSRIRWDFCQLSRCAQFAISAKWSRMHSLPLMINTLICCCPRKIKLQTNLFPFCCTTFSRNHNYASKLPIKRFPSRTHWKKKPKKRPFALPSKHPQVSRTIICVYVCANGFNSESKHTQKSI